MLRLKRRDMILRSVPGESDSIWGGPEFKAAQYN